MQENKHKGLSSIIISAVIISFFVGGASGAVFGSLVYYLSGADFFNKAQDKLASQNSAVGQTLAVEEESATTQVVEKVSPSVVSIVGTRDLSQYYGTDDSNLFQFENIFGMPFNFNSPQGQEGRQEVENGTGFIISADGLILTNKHVVVSASLGVEYSVVTNDGQRYDAEVLSSDPFNDLAVIKIKAKDLSIVELGDSDVLKIGQTVIAIGNTLGEYRNTVTRGVISGIGRSIEASGGGTSEKLENVIQTDAAINFGNSGGPLLNLAGQVIGINSAVDRQGEAVGFAIPINEAKQAIESVKKNGKIVRPVLGIRYIMINQTLQKKNNLPYDFGALIVRGSNQSELAVIPGSAADKAGLVENDIILEMDGEKLDENNSLAEKIQKYSPGDRVTLKIYHDGAEKEAQAELGEYENN